MRTIVILGDAFSRQPRDSMGVAVRLSAEGDCVVRDCSIPQGSSEQMRKLSGGLPISDGDEVLIFAGPVDSKVGGPPPAGYGQRMRNMVELVRLSGGVPSVVFVPPCPTGKRRLRGYNKASRRWLKRLPQQVRPWLNCDSMSLEFREEHWVDQLTLNPTGMKALVEQLWTWVTQGE